MAKKRKRGRPKKSFFERFKQESKIKKYVKVFPVIIMVISIYLFLFKRIPLYSHNAYFYGLIPLNIIAAFISMFMYAFSDTKDLTDNVKANRVLAPFIFIILLSILSLQNKMVLFSTFEPYYGSLPISLMFTGIYLYVSRFFQPDLDVNGRRPGYAHFPFGKWITYWRFGRFVKWLLRPVTIGWHYLWMPYGKMLTHRGVGHYPIISTWIRVFYLYIWVFGLNKIVSLFGLNVNFILDYFSMYFPFSSKFLSLDWIIFCLPIYLGDIVHISVDYIDAVKRGYPFCPNRIPRGFLITFWNELRDYFRKNL